MQGTTLQAPGVAVVLVVVAVSSASSRNAWDGPPSQGSTSRGWTEWGGPNRNFMSDATGLALSWPEGGPRRLWSRPLGEGHSAILAEGERLYTMYRPVGQGAARRSQEEIVIALDRGTGKTVWEFTYPSPTAGVDFSEGAGPHSTPLIVGNRLFAVSSRREIFALDKATGRQLWSHDFIKEYGAPSIDRGLACSPLAYKGTVIVTVGGSGQAVAAFDEATGALRWKAGDVEHSPASPILIEVSGQQQLVVFGGDRIAGMDPSTGRTLWSHPHRTNGDSTSARPSGRLPIDCFSSPRRMAPGAAARAHPQQRQSSSWTRTAHWVSRPCRRRV
jgi:outer membrane protein assembly factor BamB